MNSFLFFLGMLNEKMTKYEVLSLIPKNKEDEVLNMTLFEVIQNLANLSSAAIKKIYLISDDQASRLMKLTLENIFTCYGYHSQFKPFTLDYLLNHIKSTEASDTKSFISIKTFVMRSRFPDIVGSTFPPGYNKSISIFCPVFLNLTESIYDPHIIEYYATYYFHSNRTAVERSLEKLNIAKDFKQLQIAQSQVNNFRIEKSENIITVKLMNYSSTIMLEKSLDNTTILEVFSESLESPVSVSRALIKDFTGKVSPYLFPSLPRIYQQMKIGELKEMFKDNSNIKTLNDLIKAIVDKVNHVDSIQDLPLILAAYKEDIIGTEQMISHTPMSLLTNITKTSEKFYIYVFNLKSEVVSVMKNSTFATTFSTHFKNYPVIRLLHLVIRRFRVKGGLQYLYDGTPEEIAQRRENVILDRYEYIINNVIFSDIKKMYQIPDAALNGKNISNVLGVYMGITVDDLKKLFQEKLIIFFNSLTFSEITLKHGILQNQTLSKIGESVDLLSIESKFYFVNVFLNFC